MLRPFLFASHGKNVLFSIFYFFFKEISVELCSCSYRNSYKRVPSFLFFPNLSFLAFYTIDWPDFRSKNDQSK